MVSILFVHNLHAVNSVKNINTNDSSEGATSVAHNQYMRAATFLYNITSCFKQGINNLKCIQYFKVFLIK